jgi:hypothetical protein
MSDFVTVYDAEEFEREYGSDDSPQLPTLGAAAALIRSAGELPGVELLSPEKPYRDNLEQDGSQFILIAFHLLERFAAKVKDGEAEIELPIPADGRDFALWMLGIANGNFTEPFRCTDEQIAEVFGYGTASVRAKRGALLQWQERGNTTIIEVIEKKFNPEKGRFDPTEYVAHFGTNVSRFIRNARDNRAFLRNPVRAVEQAEQCGLIPFVEEERDELNPDLSVRRKDKKEAQPPKEDKVVKQGDVRRRLVRAAEKWGDLEYEMVGDVESELPLLLAEVERAVRGAQKRFEAKASAGRLGRKKRR